MAEPQPAMAASKKSGASQLLRTLGDNSVAKQQHLSPNSATSATTGSSNASGGRRYTISTPVDFTFAADDSSTTTATATTTATIDALEDHEAAATTTTSTSTPTSTLQTRERKHTGGSVIFDLGELSDSSWSLSSLTSLSDDEYGNLFEDVVDQTNSPEKPASTATSKSSLAFIDKIESLSWNQSSGDLQIPLTARSERYYWSVARLGCCTWDIDAQHGVGTL
jgi:hypothetical protein